MLYVPVSGEANFHIPKTGLTVGGFTQPSVTINLVELSQSSEKGLVQCFLWIPPKPLYAAFASLEQTDEKFCDYLGTQAYCLLVQDYCAISWCLLYF